MAQKNMFNLTNNYEIYLWVSAAPSVVWHACSECTG